MKAVTKTNKDGSEQVLLGAVIMKERPSRKRAKIHDLPYSIENHRLREIEKIIRHRHGRGIPDPAGTDDVELCLNYLRAVALTPDSQSAASWALVWAPWVDPVTVDLLDQTAAGRKKMPPADAVAKMLFVRLEERTMLGLKTIGACDVSKAERQISAKERKRERDRNRQEQKRREVGRVDRKSYEATSLTSLKPWEQEGISRRTWERRRVASLSRIDISTNGDTLASKPDQAPHDAQNDMHQARVAGLMVGLGDHPPAELQEAGPHGNGDKLQGRAA
ncbi:MULTISPECIES: hypothetical protein [Agrobacterium tumefaciens complex]|uniref:Uncharacterized protein n=1 Tax=Agrobacterium tomkonis CFBP 6623 TaxID=1183432 RepID=A0A1S7NVT2_9HYPH|nr:MULTISPECIES: hypothetical protein [Agrobacterium tumefaciens complex]QCL89261.1 hypothetical protein CFBP6623_08960 [Agrobacterium tumefaciens]CUX12267.1 conserved hypothetical protein [Agrobacterium tomkonis CFBP 6623]